MLYFIQESWDSCLKTITSWHLHDATSSQKKIVIKFHKIGTDALSFLQNQKGE